MLVCPKCGSTYTREVEFCGLDGEHLIESVKDPLIGRTIDRYRVVEAIGTGGMARVYRATHVYLEQDFAMKVLHGQIAADKSFAKRFHREAKTLGKIKHRNVVGVSDFGATDEGLLFLVMEYLVGPSLSAAIREEAPFSPVRAAGIARQLALGLQAAHARGFVHRDLKPANVILLEEDGVEVPKILDFGLVRLLEQEDGKIPTQLTAHGQLFGTPAYMSPEQVAGEDLDSRSDLYSLGVILYQMVTGTPPFVGDAGELIRAHVTAPPPVPALEYGGLAPLALRLLEKDADDRLQSAGEVVEAIDRLGLIGTPSRRDRAFLPTKPPGPEGFDADTGASLEIERSARDALGFRAYWRWVLAVGLFAVVGFTLWVADQQGTFDRFRTRRAAALPTAAPDAGPIEALPETPEPTPAPRKAPPERPRKKTKRPRRSRPKKQAPPPPAPPPPAPPPPAPPADAGTFAEDAGPPRTFEDLDSSLGWALSSRGLAWEDVAALEPDAALRWARWFKAKTPPSQAALIETYEILARAAREIVVDRTLLIGKLTRARRTLARVPAEARDTRYELLAKRAEELVAALRAEPLRQPPERLAAEITLLESDAGAALAEARRAAATGPTGTSTTP